IVSPESFDLVHFDVAIGSHDGEIRRVERAVGQPQLHALEPAPLDLTRALQQAQVRVVSRLRLIHGANLESAQCEVLHRPFLTRSAISSAMAPYSSTASSL